MNTKYIFFTLILSILGFLSCSANEIDSLNSGFVLPDNNVVDQPDTYETSHQGIHHNNQKNVGSDNITFTPSSSNGRRIEISFYPLIIFVLYFILS